MTPKRRKCRLVNSEHSDVDLRRFEKIIIDVVESVVPGKNPKVFKDYFSTDLLSQGEAVSLGRELSKVEQLKGFGKEVTTFRLFDGKTYDSEDDTLPSCYKKKTISKTMNKKFKGGRMQ